MENIPESYQASYLNQYDTEDASLSEEDEVEDE